MHGMIGIRPAGPVSAIPSATGLFAAAVAVGKGEARLFPGYLSAGAALAAGRRFALALGVAGSGAPVDPGFDAVPVQHHGDGARRQRHHARAMKRAWLDSLA